MTPNNLQPKKNNWWIWVLIIGILIALILFFFNPLSRNTESSTSSSGIDSIKSDTSALLQSGCLQPLAKSDSANYVKINLSYSGTLTDFDVSGFYFNGKNYSHDCLDFNADKDSLILVTYAKLDSGISIVPISSAVIAKKNKAKYTLSILVTSPKGDTLKTYSKNKTIKFLNDNDKINENLTLKRYVQKNPSAVIAHNR